MDCTDGIYPDLYSTDLETGKDDLSLLQRKLRSIIEIGCIKVLAEQCGQELQKNRTWEELPMDKVITISREFGSGGRDIGKALAKKLKIPFYDKEIIAMAAKDSNFAEHLFHEYAVAPNEGEERPEETAVTYNPFSPIYEVPLSDQIFLAQNKIICQLAAQGPCVIIGRCADRVLEDSINLFIYAKMKDRVARMKSLGTEGTEAELEAKIKEIDQRRKDYYQYNTGNTWGKAQNYDLCLSTGKAGQDGCVKTILTYLEQFK